MSNVRIIRPTEQLPTPIGASIFDLTNRTWPPSSESEVRDLTRTLERWKQRQGIHCVVTECGADEVIAHSFIFRRDILTPQGQLGIGSLASVCVDSSRRGQGLGADVVRAAFGVMTELGVEVSLFQTGVPQFYEKLGCRVVHNRFYNGQSDDKDADPFWNHWQMIYPATFDWPEGDIDINGEGY